MFSHYNFNACLTFFIFTIIQISGEPVVSYNRPKFCPEASWNPNPIEFPSSTKSGTRFYGIFVNTNDTIYLTNPRDGIIEVWLQESTKPMRTISTNLKLPYSVFVTINGDIYVDNGEYGRVDMWTLNATTSVKVMYVDDYCYGLFIDTKDNLYCSIYSHHHVVKKALSSDLTTSTIVAGDGVKGSTLNRLSFPMGIFVDFNFDLYVADCSNNRVQLFKLGQTNGLTVAGGNTTEAFTLKCPSAVVLDADGYLFITDGENHRILSSGPNGFRCLVGCSGSKIPFPPFPPSFPLPLDYPWTSLSFDSYGNIMVTITTSNWKVLSLYDYGATGKFLLSTNFCNETTAQSVQTTMTSMTTYREKNKIITTNMIETTVDEMTSLIQKEQSTMEQKLFSTGAIFVPVTSSKMIITDHGCSSLKVFLIPGTSSLLSPLQFRRYQDFYISSNIEYQCGESFSIIRQWTIFNCTNNCSTEAQIDQKLLKTGNEFYIPARTLPYGIYQINLTVTIVSSSTLTALSSAYVKITRSNITANPVKLGTSMITHGYDQDLLLNPGEYSYDIDGNLFNASNWIYKYYCRIYGVSNFPNVQGFLIEIDNETSDYSKSSCLSNLPDKKSKLIFNEIKSSLKILSKSLISNQSYQFMIILENRQNSTIQGTGYVIVHVKNSHPQMIFIGCVITKMCCPNMEFQLVNPTTQVALFSDCFDYCQSLQYIQWNIYFGFYNFSSQTVSWNLFNQTNLYENIFFFGLNTKNFTATSELFLKNPDIEYWRFQVNYSFVSEISSSSINFQKNQSPSNGSCEINPLNGTTTTLFHISCSNWSDTDGIIDYSLYTWTDDYSNQLMLGFSLQSNFQVRLPSRDNPVKMFVHIRDGLDCITQFNLSSSIIVRPNLTDIFQLINLLENSSNQIKINSIDQLLSSEDQHIIGQIITTVSQQINQINIDTVDNAISNGIPATRIIVSLLRSQSLRQISREFNQSAYIEYKKQLNKFANLREYLIKFTINLPIIGPNSIKFQSSSLSQLTKVTTQLTQLTITMASEKCYQLAKVLHRMSNQIPYEDVQIASISIAECSSNILNAINGPLQERIIILDLDLSRSNTSYDDDEWFNLNQKQIMNKITLQNNEIISSLTSALKLHLTINQKMIMNTSQMFMTIEKSSIQSLENQSITLIDNAHIRIPSNFNSILYKNSTILFQTIMEPLASFGNSRFQPNTNMSRTISFLIFDENQTMISMKTISNKSIEIIIPRDPNLILPEMILQNVLSKNQSFYYQVINLKQIQPNENLTISIHFQIRPINRNLSYLFIYRFDYSPKLTKSIKQIDGWILLCPENLTDENLYTYYINNQKTAGHRLIIYGIRELMSEEMEYYCSNISIIDPPIIHEPFNFTSNYEILIYSSGCYYLDQYNHWQSDGLVVGPLTTTNQTQCFLNQL